MVKRKNYYRILQLDYTADSAVIKSVYRTLMLKNHPDHGGSPAEAQKINEAYEILKDPIKRKQYDRENFFSLKQKNRDRYFYIRCHICSKLNAVNFNTTYDEIKYIRCVKCSTPLFSDQNEQRKSHRYQCDLDVNIQTLQNGMWIKGKSVNFSRTGMLIVTRTPLRTGQRVKLNFPHDKNFVIIADIVRVVKVKCANTSLFRHGVIYIKANYEMNKPEKNSNFTCYG